MHLIIGTGKVGLPLAQLFNAANIPALATSRSGNVPAPLTGVAFDWTDASTFENPFSRARTDSETIQCVFMTPPYIDMLETAKPFINFALSKGVRRFVLLSASLMPLSHPEYGHHAAMGNYISRLGERGVEWAVIRPSWFFQNFNINKTDISSLLYTDISNDAVQSTTGTAKLGLVDARDVAKAAFQAMTEEPAHNGSYVVFGPEMLSYGDVANTLTSITNRPIAYHKLTMEEFRAHASKFLPEEFLDVISFLEEGVGNGTEEKMVKEGRGEGGGDLWFGKRTLRDYLREWATAERGGTSPGYQEVLV